MSQISKSVPSAGRIFIRGFFNSLKTVACVLLYMVMISSPDDWDEVKSDTLNNEGRCIKFEHKHDDKVIWIEGIIDEDFPEDYEGDTLGFWGVLLVDGLEEDGPVHFTPGGYSTTEKAKDAAVEWLEDNLENYK